MGTHFIPIDYPQSIVCNVVEHKKKCIPCTADSYYIKVLFKEVNILGTCNPGPEVIKLFSSSAQLSMKFQLLINAEIAQMN